MESLAGRELATYVKELNEGVEGFSPTRRVFINQDVLEPLLHRRAIELGATVSHRTEAIALEQDDEGATVTLRDLDGGGERRVHARYVVAADGNRSPMRARLGIGMEGHGELSRSITIYFRADCAPLLRDRNQGVIYIHNPQLRGFVRLDRTRGTGFLVINTVGEDVTRPEAVNVSEGLTEDRVACVAADGDRRAGCARGDPPRRALAGRGERRDADAARARVSGRRRRARRAPQRRLRRQHRDPRRAQPGLEARGRASRSEAGPGLLDSYDAERRPLDRLTVEQAYTRYATRVVPERGTDDAEPFIDDLTMELGLVVRSRAVIGDGSVGDGVLHLPPSEVRGQPGTRSPHVALGRESLDAGPVRTRICPAAAGRTGGRDVGAARR